ncbi:unnamed protein product [Ectocarpus fasciculatus]
MALVSLNRRGIRNRSNYCYLNSSIQMLLALPGVRDMVFRSMSSMVQGNGMDTNTCPTKEDVKKVRKAAKKFKAGGGACADAATLLMAKRMTVHFLGWAFKYTINERASSGTRLESTRRKHA